jgi:hypothetical protein
MGLLSRVYRGLHSPPLTAITSSDVPYRLKHPQQNCGAARRSGEFRQAQARRRNMGAGTREEVARGRRGEGAAGGRPTRPAEEEPSPWPATRRRDRRSADGAPGPTWSWGSGRWAAEEQRDARAERAARKGRRRRARERRCAAGGRSLRVPRVATAQGRRSAARRRWGGSAPGRGGALA